MTYWIKFSSRGRGLLQMETDDFMELVVSLRQQLIDSSKDIEKIVFTWPQDGGQQLTAIRDETDQWRLVNLKHATESSESVESDEKSISHKIRGSLASLISGYLDFVFEKID